MDSEGLLLGWEFSIAVLLYYTEDLFDGSYRGGRAHWGSSWLKHHSADHLLGRLCNRQGIRGFWQYFQRNAYPVKFKRKLIWAPYQLPFRTIVSDYKFRNFHPIARLT